MNKTVFFSIIKTNKLYFFSLVFLLLNFVNCARVGRPTGGPKDETPPITLEANPDFNTINFSKNTIKIKFDEYIKLKDINEQLVISPPLKYPAEISPIGIASKEIKIIIKDTLKPNTTYSFNFGNAIEDLSEGNTLEAFSYVFSTGNYIDSLSISGFVKDAFNDKATEFISILLYKVDSSYTDSSVYKKRPDFFANTINSSDFEVANLKEGLYRVFALKDKNNNMKFDPKDEKIGFIDDPIELPNDSLISIRLFKEKPEFTIKKISELSSNHIIVGFEGDFQSRIDSIHDKNHRLIPFHYYKDSKTDSLHIWHHKIETDTLFMFFKEKDSSFQVPVRLRLKKTDSIRITSLTKRNLHLLDTLTISSFTPINKVKPSLISLTDQDSTSIAYTTSLSKSKLSLFINFNKKEKQAYTLQMLPGAIEDIYQQVSDTLIKHYKTKALEDYGEISVDLTNNANSPIIIELLNINNDIIRTAYASTSQKIDFKILTPGKFKIRLIIDKNENKEWDTGEYLISKQPENVVYYDKEIDLKANWNIIEKITIK